MDSYTPTKQPRTTGSPVTVTVKTGAPGQLVFSSPYRQEIKDILKLSGGRYNGETKTWSIDEGDKLNVFEKLARCVQVDEIIEEGQPPLITLRDKQREHIDLYVDNEEYFAIAGDLPLKLRKLLQDYEQASFDFSENTWKVKLSHYAAFLSDLLSALGPNRIGLPVWISESITKGLPDDLQRRLLLTSASVFDDVSFHALDILEQIRQVRFQVISDKERSSHWKFEIARRGLESSHYKLSTFENAHLHSELFGGIILDTEGLEDVSRMLQFMKCHRSDNQRVIVLLRNNFTATHNETWMPIVSFVCGVSLHELERRYSNNSKYSFEFNWFVKRYCVLSSTRGNSKRLVKWLSLKPDIKKACDFWRDGDPSIVKDLITCGKLLPILNFMNRIVTHGHLSEDNRLIVFGKSKVILAAIQSLFESEGIAVFRLEDGNSRNYAEPVILSSIGSTATVRGRFSKARAVFIDATNRDDVLISEGIYDLCECHKLPILFLLADDANERDEFEKLSLYQNKF